MAQPLLKPLDAFFTSKTLKPHKLRSILLLTLAILWMSISNLTANSEALTALTSGERLVSLTTPEPESPMGVLLELTENQHNNSLVDDAPCESLVLSVGTNPESACGQHDGMILIRYQDSNSEKSTYTVKIGHEEDHEIVLTGQNGNPIVVPNLYPGNYHNIRLIREVDNCESKPLDKIVTVKTTCEERISARRMGNELVLNDCSVNRAYDAYIRGVDGMTNPCIDIPNPENVTRVIVELWIEGNNPPDGVTFTGRGGTDPNSSMNVTGIPVTQTENSSVRETIYREVFDGNYAQICTSNDEGTSMAIYVERAISGGSSSVFTSDVELNGQDKDADECTTINATIGQSNLTRDLDFRIPIHEKGTNTRTVRITINLRNSVGSIIDNRTEIFDNQNAGAEASLYGLNFSDVSPDVAMAEIIVCSPEGNGESFGVGAITTSTVDCVNGSICQSLFVNPSFEQGNLNGWTLTNNTNGTVTTDCEADGTYAAVITKGGGSADAMIFQEEIASPNATYRFSFAAGTSDPSLNHEVALEFLNGNTVVGRIVQQIDFDIDFGNVLQEYVLEAIAPENTTAVRFKATSSGSVLKLDGICGTVTPEIQPWNFTCEDDVEVMIMGEGLLDTWNGSRTISFPSDNVTRVIAEANFRDSNGSCRPETVRFTDSNGASKIAFGRSINGPSSRNSATFRAEFFGNFDGITLDDVENDCTPISYVLYIFKENTGNGKGANGLFINKFFFQDSETFNIPLTGITEPADITVRVPVTDLACGPTARISVNAGGISDSRTFTNCPTADPGNTFEGADLVFVDFTLSNVPANTNNLSLTIESPTNGGGSFFVSSAVGLEVMCGVCTKPNAVADNGNAFETCPNKSLNGNVRTNDEALSNPIYTIVDDVSNGDLNLNTDGTFTYLPNNNSCGTDEFRYRVCNDGSNEDTCCDEAVVRIGVIDNENPTFNNFPSDLTVSCDDVPNQATNITASDNCDDNVTVVFVGETVDPISGANVCDQTFRLTRTWRATDDCGNETIRNQIIRVEDNDPPVITPPANDTLTVECDGNGNQAELQAWLADNGGATVTDNCGEVTWTVDFNFDNFIFECGGEGWGFGDFTATDECGNTADYRGIFRILDTTDPVITTDPSNMFVECDGNGNQQELQDWLDDNAGGRGNDVCSPAAWEYSLVNETSDCGATGSMTYNFKLLDECGNESSRVATFTIQDTEIPIVPCDPTDLVHECTGDADNQAVAEAWNLSLIHI